MGRKAKGKPAELPPARFIHYFPKNSENSATLFSLSPLNAAPV